MNILSKSIKDYFSFRILGLTFLPCLLCLVALCVLMYMYGAQVREWILDSSKTFLPSWLMEGGIGSVFEWFLSLCLWIIQGVFIVLLSLVFNLLISVFYTPFIISYIQKKHYQHIELGTSCGFGESLGGMLKIIALFAVIFILCIPLYFVPLVGSFVLFLLGYVFFKKCMFYDVGSTMMDKDGLKAFLKGFHISHHAYAFLAYLFSFVPLFNFFAMPLQLLIVGHYFFSKTKH